MVFLKGLSCCQLFPVFINDFLSCTSCPVHSSTDDSTSLYSADINHLPTEQELGESEDDTQPRLSSTLSLVSSWSRENLVIFSAVKIHFLPDSYALLFNDTQHNVSSILIILRVLFPIMLRHSLCSFSIVMNFRILTLHVPSLKKSSWH